MEAFLQRILDEKNDLDDKIEKLSVFIATSSIFIALDSKEQHNLRLQIRMKNLGII